VVVGDIPLDCVAVGNPCKVVKRLSPSPARVASELGEGERHEV